MAQTPELFPLLNSARLKKATEAERRLPPWLSHPTHFPAVNLYEMGQDIEEFSEYIDEDLIRYLKKNMLLARLFPVQKCLIPSLTRQLESRAYRRPHDFCVSSPTGSGKTLAFAIPIVNYLKKTINRSLRALVILPSRDLAVQVHKTFLQVCASTSVRCALAAESQDANKNLLRKVSKKSADQVDECLGKNPMRQFSILQNLSHKQAVDSPGELDDQSTQYVSTVDILVSTPGVLTDLLHNTPGFSLMDLEILVMDEADRLMSMHKHDWLNTIERSIFSDIPACACSAPPKDLQQRSKKMRTCYHSVTGCSVQNSHKSKPLQKLLFSATLSSDPQLLLHMNLFQPRLFLATKPSITSTKIRQSLGSQNNSPACSPAPSFSSTVNTRSELMTSTAIPDQLEEKMFVIEAKEKLFIMWYFFYELKYKRVICFTNQLPTSFKLCKFLNEIHGVRAVEFSSNLKQETRAKYLTEFKLGRIDVIVSTDLMARGMDVEGVDYVISYDMPMSEIFYVHRVGRTARAGNKGTAITLVDTKQLVQFKKIVQLAHKMPNSMRLSDVVEEMKVPPLIKKNADKQDLYNKTLENYEDKLNELAKKNKFCRKKP